MRHFLMFQLSVRDMHAGVIDKIHDKGSLVRFNVLAMCLCNVNALLITCHVLLNEMGKRCFIEARTKTNVATALFF